ncbi:MAG: DUF1553 domain-containing protein [Planctomycetota bacterium]
MIAWSRRACRIALLAAVSGSLARAQEVDFDREVRPILADRCFSCHGPDAAARKAELRLDRFEFASAVRADGSRAIAPGDLEQSLAWARVCSTNADERMPPPDSGPPLTAAQVQILKRWIAAGAPYTEHWAFAPLPTQIELPPVRDPALAARIRNPIDAFVLAALEDSPEVPAELDPAPEASMERLFRRATLTLTGLPPTLEQTRRFLGDPSPANLALTIDAALSSAAHAEHMAQGWLDAARYADTYGYQSDVHREVWPWRDWVIDAFQKNLPYDEFLTWQLAGDLIPHATHDQRLATAFLRLGRMTNEGGSVEEEFRVEVVCDRLETVGTAMLGLTLGCARCHDHKFDPISQREYFGLFALFDDADEAGLYSHFTDAVPTPTLWLPTAEQARRLADSTAEIESLEERLAAHQDRSKEEFDRWLAAQATAPMIAPPFAAFGLDAFAADGALPNRIVAKQHGKVVEAPSVTPGAVDQAMTFHGEDGAVFPGVADFDENAPFTISAWLRVDRVHERAVVWHRSRAWTDAGSRGYELLLIEGRLSAALVHFWPGNAIAVAARESFPIGSFHHVAVRYDGSSRASGLQLFVDGKEIAVDVVRDKLTRTIQGGGADALTLAHRFRDYGLAGGSLDELTIHHRELSTLEIAELAEPGSLATRFAERDRADVRSAWREFHDLGIDATAQQLRTELKDKRRARSQIVAQIREIMTMRDELTRTAYRLERGLYDRRAEAVDASLPASLPDWPPDARRDRAGFARSLTHPEHPLTARVAVNRIWQMHFGRGLVTTPEDFGVQGDRPSHPQLLDWLARWFVDHDFDLFALHRLILDSATWRQDSRVAAEQRARDPDNRRLARGPSFRLSAEVIRDSALAAAELLDRKVGGPSVKPYQPPGLWEEKSGAAYKPDTSNGLWRRSLYTYWKRTSPPPAMTTMDAPSREVTCVRRTTTQNPLQALLLMNDPQFVEAARVLAQRVLSSTPSSRAASEDAERIESMFLRTLSRRPRARESEVLLDQVDEARSVFTADTDAAAKLIGIGHFPADLRLPDGELAAWTMVASTLLCHDECSSLR